MKDLIVTTGVIVLLLVFPLQYALQQHNHNRVSELQGIVNSAKERAKAEGCFTEEIISDLTSAILEAFPDIDESQIVIEATMTPRYRQNEFDERELIFYRIEVPVGDIIAMPGFWGIESSDNSYTYVIDKCTTSERILN